MFIPKCLFCDHTNPADAKYCNECGSPLHLQLCKQCDAINDAAAKICHKCGTAIATPVITPDLAALTPVAESIAAVTSGYAGLEREHPSPSRTTAESQVSRVRRPASHATASDPIPMSGPLLLHLDRIDPYGRSPLCEPLDTSRAVASQMPGTTALRRRKYRVAMAALFPAVLLGAVAVFAYHAYRQPVQLGEQISPPSTVPQPIETEAGVETIVETQTGARERIRKHAGMRNRPNRSSPSATARAPGPNPSRFLRRRYPRRPPRRHQNRIPCRQRLCGRRTRRRTRLRALTNSWRDARTAQSSNACCAISVCESPTARAAGGACRSVRAGGSPTTASRPAPRWGRVGEGVLTPY